MPELVRKIIAVVSLLALMCGGQLSVCACELELHDASLDHHGVSHVESSDHQHHHDHDHHHDEHHHSSGSSSHDDEGPHGLHCHTCHSCQHAQVIIPQVITCVFVPNIENVVCEAATSPSIRPADIFDPPKLS